MNWGHKIVISFVLFAGFVLFLVFRMITSGNDVLRSSYYRSGPEINTELKLMEASQSLNDQITIERIGEKGEIVQMKWASLEEPYSGTIELISLSSEKGDGKWPLELTKSGDFWVQDLILKNPVPGNWLCEIKGNQGNKPFLIRKEFN